MRLLVVYLEEHRVAVDFMVELGIVATLREVVLRGVVELGWAQVLAISGFLLTLGALLRFGTWRAQLHARHPRTPRAESTRAEARGAERAPDLQQPLEVRTDATLED
ncbi:MAG: phosphate-starvation-inducible PsiE family protein [Thermomicrobium sp.]|nr:phosphate-starvation-inducible PsiE family protein [Thermomicrobium sp.]MDW8059779.1 phosphate-starvation-inducible PsiE family protein [Thermomicrobium sp.]